MQSEEQYLQEQFESMQIELQRQLIALALHYNQNVEDYKKVLKLDRLEAEDKNHALTKGAVCLHVLIALDETKPTEPEEMKGMKHISTHIDTLYNQVKKHR